MGETCIMCQVAVWFVKPCREIFNSEVLPIHFLLLLSAWADSAVGVSSNFKRFKITCIIYSLWISKMPDGRFDFPDSHNHTFRTGIRKEIRADKLLSAWDNQSQNKQVNRFFPWLHCFLVAFLQCSSPVLLLLLLVVLIAPTCCPSLVLVYQSYPSSIGPCFPLTLVSSLWVFTAWLIFCFAQLFWF